MLVDPCCWLIRHWRYLQNLKTTLLPELAKIYWKKSDSLQALEYPIFGVLTPDWAPRVIWNYKLNTPVLIIAEKAYSNYNIILLLLSPPSLHQFLWRFLKKVWNNSLCYVLALNPVCPTYITVPLILKGLTDRHI